MREMSREKKNRNYRKLYSRYHNGRYDITLFPGEKKYPGIIMELKWKSSLGKDELEELSREVLSQIDEKRYDLELKEEGIENVIKLGIAFSGKKVVIKTV